MQCCSEVVGVLQAAGVHIKFLLWPLESTTLNPSCSYIQQETNTEKKNIPSILAVAISFSVFGNEMKVSSM